MKPRLARWRAMPQWLIPMAYTMVSIVASLILPRLEEAYLGRYVHEISVNAAIAFFSAVSSGMMALTGIVFAIAFVVVQFSALAYSPRLVLLFNRDPTTFHALGVFFATFTYSLAALVWTDRNGSGKVPVFSSMLVLALLVVSLLMFARMIQSLNALQIHNVLRTIGNQGRSVIREMFVHLPEYTGAEALHSRIEASNLGSAVQTLTYIGEPMVIARYEISALVKLAEESDALLVMECGVGETLVEGTALLKVHRARQPLDEQRLMHCIRLETSRTYEQDPKYAIRLLVDIAIRALSPAINDPTTAVQALDQIEDLLRRLGRRELDAGQVADARGIPRLIFPVPTWQDYLAVSFDEIRRFGGTSVQVVRRLRSVLVGLAEAVNAERRNAVLRYIEHLNFGVDRSDFDAQDRASALEEDRQGLGLSRRRPPGKLPEAGLQGIDIAAK